MREISGEEYVNNVEDVITNNIEGAIASSFHFISREYGFATDFYEREKSALAISDELWYSGTLGHLRDEVIALFEKHGMNIRPDGKEW